MADQDKSQRTEAATARKLEKSREKGQVPRSKEIGAALSLFGFLGMAWLVGAMLVDSTATMFRSVILNAPAFSLTQISLQTVMTQSALQAGMLMAPFLGVVTVAIIAGSLAQGGFVISGESLKLNFGRLNPTQALQPLLTGRTPIEGLRTALKIGLYVAIAWNALVGELDGLVALGASSAPQILPGLASIVGRVMWRMALVGLVLALADMAWQRWRFLRDQRMTKKELKDERKEMDGDPHIKAKIRGRMQALARSRMLDDVKKASVVVVNPTHVAVALRYDQFKMVAPTMVAAGRGRVAQRIRDAARKARVPIVSDPPLARLLESVGEIGQEIPHALFRAVAGVLAWVTLRRRGERARYKREVSLPTDLPIGPAALRAARRETRRARRGETR